MAGDQSPAEGTPQTMPLTALFESLEAPLLGYARKLARNGAAAEDAVQEAFLRLHAQWANVRAPRQWLFRTVHNLTVSDNRRDARQLPLEAAGEAKGAAASGAPPGPDEEAARWEEIERLRLCLKRLDKRNRELLRLKFFEGLSYREIAERMGLTVGHVGYLLHHALKTLAADFEEAIQHET
ncbi:MAG: sigma-70 family RNA polymerase sigma factor [Verrucomicrobia bacterium]|nr:sigma-70 family RNA polymerase sigma factor [Verrucomicrobiota bacterium]